MSSRAEVDGTMRSFQEMISYGTDPRPLSLVFMQARTASGERSKLNVLPVPNRKYQFMEVNTQRRAAGLKEKMPDIQKTLDMVRFLKTRKVSRRNIPGTSPIPHSAFITLRLQLKHTYAVFQPGSEDIETTFELNDTLYAKALVPPTDEVYLWLGASVMLAYPIDEAETLLESKLGAAKQNLANCEEDLDFLREQITVRHSHIISPLCLEVFLVGEVVALMLGNRLSRSLRRGCITGMSRRRGGRRRRGEERKRMKVKGGGKTGRR